MTEYELALQIATKEHKGQKDKTGVDYILHLIKVSSFCKTDCGKIAALLHDVVKDTNTTFDDLRDAGISENIIVAVDCLTKREDEELGGYYNRVATNDIAIEVKFAEMRHNSEKTRWPKNMQEKAEENCRKYFTHANLLYVIAKLCERGFNEVMTQETYNWFWCEKSKIDCGNCFHQYGRS